GDDILNQLVSFENMVPNTKSLHAFAIWTIYKSRVEMNLQNILADGIVMFTRWLVEVKEQIVRDVKKGKAAAKSWQTPKNTVGKSQGNPKLPPNTTLQYNKVTQRGIRNRGNPNQKILKISIRWSKTAATYPSSIGLTNPR
ncbi:hypothetical protein BB558_007087, partial [Smittium angustum]